MTFLLCYEYVSSFDQKKKEYVSYGYLTASPIFTLAHQLLKQRLHMWPSSQTTHGSRFSKRATPRVTTLSDSPFPT